MGIISSRLNSRVSPTKMLDEPIKSPSTQTFENDPAKIPPNTILNRFLIVWLDANLSEIDEIYQNSISRLQRIASSIERFTNLDECLQFLNNNQSEKILMIISNDFVSLIWPQIKAMSQIHSVYIISTDREKENLTENQSEKVKGIFSSGEPICGSVKRNNVQFCQDALVMSIIPSTRYTRKGLQRLNHLFLFWMLVKSIIRDFTFQRDFYQQSIKDLANLCRREYFSDPNQLKMIDEFEKSYRQHSPIWWYTRDSFLSSMLSQAFQTRDMEVIIRMAFFIKDLFQQMERIQSIANKNLHLPIISYRSQHVSIEDFQQIEKLNGHLLSFNNFVMTDPDYEVSLQLTRKSQKNNAGVTIFFAIKVDGKHTSNPYVSLQNLSYAPEQGKFLLFGMHSIFRITEIKKLDEQIYQIDLTLTSSNDEQVMGLTELLRQETRTVPHWLKLAHLMTTIRDFDQAKEIYLTLLDLSENDPLKTARIYNELGLIDDELGDYDSALIYYQKAIDIRREELPANHRSLGVSYNNIGEVQRQLGDYFNALTSHKKTLHLKQKILRPNDLSLATTYNNLGLASEALADYPNALTFYQKSLEIKEKVLPLDDQEIATTLNNIGELHRLMGDFPAALSHLERAMNIRLKKYRRKDASLAVLYNNIGLIHREMGNYSKALSYLQKSLEIKIESFRENHPSFQYTYNNIGDLQQQLGEYSNALISYKKALEIQEKVFHSEHPEIATTYTNLGVVNQAMGNYSQALSFYQSAVEIREKSLPANHPSLATCFNNIGHVQQLMGQFEVALEFYQRTLKIQEKTLSKTHPSLATTYNNMADAHRKLGNLDKSLRLYKKSLDIKKKSLPADHPSLVITYNNIGAINHSMKNYPEALEYYRLTVEVQKKSGSQDHPELAAVYNNIGVTHQSMKEYSIAQDYYQKALEIQEKVLRVDHPDIATTHNSLATVYVHLGDFPKALEHEKRAVHIASLTLKDDHPNLLIFRSHLEQIAKFVENNP